MSDFVQKQKKQRLLLNLESWFWTCSSTEFNSVFVSKPWSLCVSIPEHSTATNHHWTLLREDGEERLVFVHSTCRNTRALIFSPGHEKQQVTLNTGPKAQVKSLQTPQIRVYGLHLRLWWKLRLPEWNIISVRNTARQKRGGSSSTAADRWRAHGARGQRSSRK